MDDDSRAMFQNAQEYAEMYPDAPQAAGYCARRVTEGYELEDIRQRLWAVAGARKAAEVPKWDYEDGTAAVLLPEVACAACRVPLGIVSFRDQPVNRNNAPAATPANKRPLNVPANFPDYPEHVDAGAGSLPRSLPQEVWVLTDMDILGDLRGL